MKKTAIPIFISSLTLLLLSLSGCGGASSSADSPTAIHLSGVVEDGPVENAKISLRDQENNILAVSNSVSERDGAFSLQVPLGTLFTGLRVVAVDGRDRATGVDFTGLEMCSPLELFTNDLTTLVISPLTTLIAELQDPSSSLAVVQKRLKDWLILPAATDLTARPFASLDLQRRTLLLTKIALEIKAVSPDSNPFSIISAQMLVTNTLDAAIVNPGVMGTLGLDAAAQARVRDLQMLLATATTVDNAAYIYKREELLRIFATNVEQMLIDSASFDPLNASYRENLRILAESTLQAAGNEVIPLGGTIPQRIARYLLFTYQLRTWESLTLDPAVFAENLTSLANDPWVAELARSRSLYSVVSPLPFSDLPGNDNQQRLTYFYGSDLSPHYQAEQLIGQVFDDAINDAVLLKIVEGKANAGLIDETRTIIATQIVKSEAKATACLVLAKALIKFNRSQEALGDLDLARDLYRKVILSKGIASSSSADVYNLLQTSRYYQDAGDLASAESLLTDIAAIAQALEIDAVSYGRLITGIKRVADSYLAVGDLTAAAPLVEAMYLYAGQTPAFRNKYQLRVYNWGECAKRYADLGNQAMVLQIRNDIQALRAADGLYNLTGTATWVYIPDLVESLYRVGATDAAWELANTIPSYSTALGKAFKLVATYEALQGNLAAAFNIVDNLAYFPKVEDRLELLTYFTPQRPYIAQALINFGRFTEAQQALEEAERLLDGMIGGSNLLRIRSGYVKVAELYTLMGVNTKAAALLEKAQVEMIDDAYRVEVMVDIALGYHKLNQTETALSILASAQSLATTDPTVWRVSLMPSPSTPEEAATIIYEKLVKAYEEIGEKSLVLTTVNFLLPWAQSIHPVGTVEDTLAGKECDYLLRAALYLDRAGYHDAALNVLAAAKEGAGQIVIAATRLKKYLSVIETYAAVHEYEKGLGLALSLEYTTERNQAIQSLANAYINRDDFPETLVASIDSDGDGHPDFFHPLASTEKIAASGLLLDNDSDGDGIVDTLDLRPLFADK